MIKYSFFLKEPKAKKSLIFLALRNNNKRVVISTGLIEITTTWDKNKYEVNAQSPTASFTNEILLHWKAVTSQAIREAELSNDDLNIVKENILIRMNKKEKKDSQSLFLPFFKIWATEGTANKPHPTRQNLQSFRVFSEFIKKKELTFQEIDYNLYSAYTIFLRNVKNYRPNTIGTHIRNLKAVMNEAYKQGLHTNLEYKNFSKEEEEVYNIYLTTEELDKLYRTPFGGMKEITRDLFLIGCYTVSRFSDYSKFSPLNLQNKYLRYIQQKTGEPVAIPAPPIVKELIDKWGGSPKISQANFNSNLKIICREAGIKGKVLIKKTIGGITQTEYKEKWELVTSHTARRTGVTNLLKEGKPTTVVMKIGGFKSESSFWKYCKLTIEEYAEILIDSEFLNKK